ncbi:MAG: hypothetical protein WCG06_03555, partial [Candidatus Omnitrophota bacterium]
MKLAVYDIGTNSIHLLIVRIKDDFSFEVVDHEKDFTRLGHGSFESNTLSREAIARTCRVLKRFGQIVRKSGVRKVIGVATSAVRQAQNGQALVEAARRSSGLRVRVISGQEEARLVFIAALSSVETNGRRTLAIDIGGGSAELVVGDRDQTNFTGCYPLGVARLTETYLRHDPPTKKDLRRLEKAVDRQLGVDAKKIRRLHPAMTIGTAGTIIN